MVRQSLRRLIERQAGALHGFSHSLSVVVTCAPSLEDSRIPDEEVRDTPSAYAGPTFPPPSESLMKEKIGACSNSQRIGPKLKSEVNRGKSETRETSRLRRPL